MDRKVFLDNCFRVGVVIVSSIIYSIGLIWFLEPANLYAGGLSGLSQLINRLFLMLFDKTVNIGLLIFILNIPVLFIGYRFVSKKFALFSLVSIAVQSLCTSGIIPVLEFDLDVLTLAIVGGIVTAFGCGLALRYGTSTGGLDIIGQVLALHKGISIGIFSLVFNIILAIVGGGLLQGDWSITLYTFIRIIISALVTDKVHTAYNFLSMHIITSNGEDMSQVLLKELGRGCTIYPAQGAYTHNTKLDLFMVVSAYEYERAKEIIQRLDERAFVVVSPVKRLIGNFKRKSIV